jgi:hypothetical protein
MSILGAIIAKVLGLTELILDNFVTVAPSTTEFVNGCGTVAIPVYEVTYEACGYTLAAAVANLLVMGLDILNGVLPGLMAVEA